MNRLRLQRQILPGRDVACLAFARFRSPGARRAGPGKPGDRRRPAQPRSQRGNRKHGSSPRKAEPAPTRRLLHGPAHCRCHVVARSRLAVPRDASRGRAARGDARRPQDPARRDRGRRRGRGRLSQHSPGTAGRAHGDGPGHRPPAPDARDAQEQRPRGRRHQHQTDPRNPDRHQASRREGRPDPDGRRLPRVLRPRDDPQRPLEGPQTAAAGWSWSNFAAKTPMCPSNPNTR